MSNTESSFWKKNKLLVFLLLVSFVLLIFSCFSPIIFTQHGAFDFSSTGEIGDTINGLMSPFIAIMTAVLTFGAFYIQYNANQMQISEIRKQDSQRNKENIESNIIHLLNIHRQNVNDIQIYISETQNRKGQEVFDYFWKIIDILIHREGITVPGYPISSDKPDSKKSAISAFLFVYFGERIIKSSLIRTKYAEYISEKMISDYRTFAQSNPELVITENGYGLALSRYYRHLYQIVRYLDDDKVLTNEEKYYYAKMIRSTLTNTEQVILFYNVLSPLGSAWRIGKYLYTYKLIKNVPIYLISGYKPTTYFMEEYRVIESELPKYFEDYE